jgi:hypothetical protein
MKKKTGLKTRKLPTTKVIATEPESPPEQSDDNLSEKEWQKEVQKHCQPGEPIPDWLAAKAPR